jgi:hypothetical protein
MRRTVLWTMAFALVAVFALAGAFFDDKSQRTWALVSTIGLIGAVLIVAVLLAIGGLQRLHAKALRMIPRPFRRR